VLAERQERIRTLFLTIPEISLNKCLNNQELLEQIPIQEQEGIVVI
jgi:hypothetical protein